MQKHCVYSPIPEFDQYTQFVVQQEPVDMGDYYLFGNEVCVLVDNDTTDYKILILI